MNDNFLFFYLKTTGIYLSDQMDFRQFLAILFGSMLFWMLIVLDLSPISLPSSLHSIIVLLPFLGLLSFGVYSLFYLTRKVINLKDRPDAQLELQREIEEIRRDPRYCSLFRPATKTSNRPEETR